MLISFLCDYDNKNFFFLLLRILADISGNMVIQIKFYLLCICSVALSKKSGELFFFFHFSNKQTNHMLLWRAWTASPIYSEEATHPGHMLIRFWCDSDITFSCGLHKNLVTVLYFSIINVLCGASEDASFAPSGKSSSCMCLMDGFHHLQGFYHVYEHINSKG